MSNNHFKPHLYIYSFIHESTFVKTIYFYVHVYSHSFICINEDAPNSMNWEDISYHMFQGMLTID